MKATPNHSASNVWEIAPGVAQRLIAKRSFCTLATVSAAKIPHVTGVLYVPAADAIFINTLRTSRKSRNIAANPNVSICIPVRRIPFGPPSNLQFSGHAELLNIDDARIDAPIESEALKPITSHGELDVAGSCFIRVTRIGRINAYGLGMALHTLVRDPLHAAGVVRERQLPNAVFDELDEPAA